MDILIRPERPDDFPAIEALHRAAFGGEFEARIVNDIRVMPEYLAELSLVAEVSGQIAGHVLLSLLHHDNPKWEGKLLALGPISVLPPLQRQGVGMALMEAAIERAGGLGYKGIALIGHPTYYPRFGFKPSSTWDIALPYNVPDDVAMAVELAPGSLDGAGGKVRYSDAFAE